MPDSSGLDESCVAVSAVLADALLTQACLVSEVPPGTSGQCSYSSRVSPAVMPQAMQRGAGLVSKDDWASLLANALRGVAGEVCQVRGEDGPGPGVRRVRNTGNRALRKGTGRLAVRRETSKVGCAHRWCHVRCDPESRRAVSCNRVRRRL